MQNTALSANGLKHLMNKTTRQWNQDYSRPWNELARWLKIETEDDNDRTWIWCEVKLKKTWLMTCLMFVEIEVLKTERGGIVHSLVVWTLNQTFEVSTWYTVFEKFENNTEWKFNDLYYRDIYESGHFLKCCVISVVDIAQLFHLNWTNMPFIFWITWKTFWIFFDIIRLMIFLYQ